MIAPDRDVCIAGQMFVPHRFDVAGEDPAGLNDENVLVVLVAGTQVGDQARGAAVRLRVLLEPHVGSRGPRPGSRETAVVDDADRKRHSVRGWQQRQLLDHHIQNGLLWCEVKIQDRSAGRLDQR